MVSLQSKCVAIVIVTLVSQLHVDLKVILHMYVLMPDNIAVELAADGPFPK